MDCGPTCLRMIAKFYGNNYSLQNLRDKCYIDREGVSLKGIAVAAESVGFRSIAVKIPFAASLDSPSLTVAPLPCIVHWNQNHFVVVYKVSKKYVWIADPGEGKLKIPVAAFLQSWLSKDESSGIALLLEPTPHFYQNEEADLDKKFGLSYLFAGIYT